MAQLRKPITDGAHGEPWVYRYKDIRNWWARPHFNRIDGLRDDLATDWVPGSKPIRFTEYGCAAIDKGANQPNKFLDPKSSESLLPKFSSGRRDDLMQMQYLIAMHDHWTDVANNPEAVLYPGRMVDWDHAHAWAWDARPFPTFPGRSDIWTDGDNYARGHWLTGRASSQTLAAVVAELCESGGLTAIDVRGLYGVVRGYISDRVDSPRASLQSLMLAHGFDAIDRDGVLVFRMRTGRVTRRLDPGCLALTDAMPGRIETSRLSEADLTGRVLVSHYEAEAEFELRQSEARFPDDAAISLSQSELPMTLTTTEGVAVAERWLSEARVARDTARFALPLSQADLGAGDVVEIEGQRYRIDRLEQTEVLMADALRTEAALYQPATYHEDPVSLRAYQAPLPVYPLLLDLPLMTGEETPHAPHLAASARPWRGQVALWSSDQDAGYAFNVAALASATVGRTETALVAAEAGRWDRGPAVRVRMGSGILSSASQLAVLNGANAMAIGDPQTGVWEVMQFANAELLAPRTYDLSLRLRGQLGTDGVMPSVWPAGSQVVLLDRTLVQVDLAASVRGLSRHYRIGLAERGYDDAQVVHLERAFDGVGLRPYAPAHLRASASGGSLQLRWVRRTRIDGDNWASTEVPLGEDGESYLVEVRQGSAVLRQATVSAPNWSYSASEQAADGAAGAVTLAVAQISARFGPGPAARCDLIL